MDDRKMARRRFLREMAAALGGLAVAPALTAVAQTGPPAQRGGWVWDGRRWVRPVYRPRYTNRYVYPGTVVNPAPAPAVAPQRYYYAPRYVQPRPVSVWGGGSS